MGPEQILFMYIMFTHSILYFADSLYVLHKGMYDRYGVYARTSAMVYGLRTFFCMWLSLLDIDMAIMMIVVSVAVDILMHRNVNKQKVERHGY
jgi:hypothetical protein